MNTFKTTLLCAIFFAGFSINIAFNALYAVNFVNGRKTDSNGLVYEPDNGTCEFTLQVVGAEFAGISLVDLPLYNPYCVNSNELMREIPLDNPTDGTYLLVLRLMEIMTDANDKQINMNVMLNDKHQHLRNFTIFNAVSTLHAYDEHIYFSVCKNELL
jgi:hypothetical protein